MFFEVQVFGFLKEFEMSRARTRYLRAPVYSEGLKCPVLFEGWKFSEGDGSLGSDWPCIECQVGMPNLEDLLYALVEESRRLVDGLGFSLCDEDEEGGGFGFFTCRLFLHDKDSVIRQVEYVDVEPARLSEIVSKLFLLIWRNGYVSLEIAPQNDDFSFNVEVRLTRDKLIQVFTRDPKDLMEFLDVFDEHQVRRYRKLTLVSSKWRVYRSCRNTSQLWDKLLADLNPQRVGFNRFDLGEGDLPSGV